MSGSFREAYSLGDTSLACSYIWSSGRGWAGLLMYNSVFMIVYEVWKQDCVSVRPMSFVVSRSSCLTELSIFSQKACANCVSSRPGYTNRL